MDDPEAHDVHNSGPDQTWYFALADCDGVLEIFKDENSKDHLLGLDMLWVDIDEDDYKDYEYKDRRGGPSMRNIDADSFEETNLMQENMDIRYGDNFRR